MGEPIFSGPLQRQASATWTSLPAFPKTMQRRADVASDSLPFFPKWRSATENLPEAHGGMIGDTPPPVHASSSTDWNLLVVGVPAWLDEASHIEPCACVDVYGLCVCGCALPHMEGSGLQEDQMLETLKSLGIPTVLARQAAQLHPVAVNAACWGCRVIQLLQSSCASSTTFLGSRT